MARHGVVAAGRAGAPVRRGQAFPIAELLRIREFAAARGLGFAVQLDRVVEGMEDEEVVWLCPRLRGRSSLSLWRTASGVIVQRRGAAPHYYPSLERALAGLAPKPRAWWKDVLF
jgi:hypothetical protein